MKTFLIGIIAIVFCGNLTWAAGQSVNGGRADRRHVRHMIHAHHHHLNHERSTLKQHKAEANNPYHHMSRYYHQ